MFQNQIVPTKTTMKGQPMKENNSPNGHEAFLKSCYVRVDSQVVPNVMFGMVGSICHALWHNLHISKLPFVFPILRISLRGYQSYEEVTPLVALHML